MTALRLVQRMKRDSIHSGRRPSGVCGAALLIAARLHNFSRTPSDVVRIVRVHESTLRKRLLEFGDTPSSALTLDEFMTVDLEEEQDPPIFKEARKRDKERLQKLMEEEDGERELSELQKEIEEQLEKDNAKKKKLTATPSSIRSGGADESINEEDEATRFAEERTISLIGELAKTVSKDTEESATEVEEEKELGPEKAVIGISHVNEKTDTFLKPEPKTQLPNNLTNADELVLGDEDEAYIDSLIMTADEARYKTKMWKTINAGYLRDQKIKEEIRAKEKEEGKDRKKKVRGSYRKKVNCNAATAGEAIGKMLAEKKMSLKINYDILKSLDQPGVSIPVSSSEPVVESPKDELVESKTPGPPPSKKKKKKAAPPSDTESNPPTPAPETPVPSTPIQKDIEADDYEEEIDTTENDTELSLASMLQNQQEDDYYDYEEY
ncbi:unnamed protein product [Pieris macdunnoughi]|nr:unnamed protein product [Pieris macdunnoughi]